MSSIVNVQFIADLMIVSVSIEYPDIDDQDYLIKLADTMISEEYGFSPLKFANEIKVNGGSDE